MPIYGRVFDVSRGCVDDGPGLRTVVYLKGCSLDCPWCHNLEGKAFEPEIAFDPARCIHCGHCREVCPRSWPPTGDWREECVVCGECAAVCPASARRLVGRRYEVADLVREALEDRVFFSGTGGGVTFSGGEPLAQARFVLACAKRLREEGIHLAVETSGSWPGFLVDQIVDHFDLVLFDLKHTDPGKFEAAIGQENERVLENLERFLGEEIPLELRITLVPGFNDSEQDLLGVAAWLKERARIPPVRLLGFHRLARAKRNLLDKPYDYAETAPVTEERLAAAAELLRLEGIVEVVAQSPTSARPQTEPPRDEAVKDAG